MSSVKQRPPQGYSNVKEWAIAASAPTQNWEFIAYINAEDRSGYSHWQVCDSSKAKLDVINEYGETAGNTK